MHFNKKAVLLTFGVCLLAIASGCSEKQYATSGTTPAASKAPATSPVATPNDGRAKPGSDDPGAK